MIRHIAVLMALVCATLTGGCASKLDAAATSQNATNVKSLVAHVAELHVKAKSDSSLVKADAETGKSYITLAEAMAEAAAK